MCFSLGWIEAILVWLVIVAAVVMLLRLLVPWVLGMIGVGGGVITQAITIVIGAIVVITVIYFGFALISCIGGFPAFPHPR